MPDYNHSFGGNRNNPYPKNNIRSSNVQPHEIFPQKVPDDYVDAAEKLMARSSRFITTSKLRSLMSLASGVYNVENLRTEPQLLPESITQLNLMRMHTAYECGRDFDIKNFVQNAHILNYLKWFSTDRPESRQDLINFYHYLEAIVAFHRYFGGKENRT